MSQFHSAAQFEPSLDTWRIFARLILHKKRMILVIVGTALISTYVLLQLLSDQYATEAKLLVKLGPENVEVPVTAQSGNVTTMGVRKEEIHSEVQLLKSRGLISQTVEKLGADAFTNPTLPPTGMLSSLKHSIKGIVRGGKKAGEALLVSLNLTNQLDDRQKAILSVEKSLLVEPVRESDVITVYYKSKDPNLCVRFVETLLQLYLENHTRLRRNTAARDFYQAQMQNQLERLHQIEASRNEVKAKWKLYAVADQRSLLLKELMELRTQIDLHASERAMYQQQQKVMQARMDVLPDSVSQSETISPNPTVRQFKDQVANLQLEKARLSSRFAPGSQTLSDLDSQIATLTKLMQEEEATQVAAQVSASNPVKREFQQGIEQLNVKIAGLDARIRELQLPATKIENRLNGLNSSEDLLEKVIREQKLAEETYMASARRLEAARIANELDQNRAVNVAILSPPTIPLEPVSPRRLLMLMLALPAGTMLAIGFVLVLYYFQVITNESPTPGPGKAVPSLSKPSITVRAEPPDGSGDTPR